MAVMAVRGRGRLRGSCLLLLPGWERVLVVLVLASRLLGRHVACNRVYSLINSALLPYSS